jgi:hypothetical protein
LPHRFWFKGAGVSTQAGQSWRRTAVRSWIGNCLCALLGGVLLAAGLVAVAPHGHEATAGEDCQCPACAFAHSHAVLPESGRAADFHPRIIPALAPRRARVGAAVEGFLVHGERGPPA